MISAVGPITMKKYIGMIEVLGEGGELQPLYWNPKHLVDGRAILIVDEPEALIWIWLGRGTSMLQRTTALRQARFIMRNGIHVDKIQFGTKCTNFIEISGDLQNPKASILRKLLETTQKTSDFLVTVESEPEISTFDEVFQDKIDAIEQTIVPEPTRRVAPIRRRILSYEEQLSSKVLFAVADCYGQASISPIGPNEFQVSVLRLQLRFFCQGDEIFFSEIRAASQEDLDAFARCYGQQPQLAANGQQFIAPAITSATPAQNEGKAVSVVDSMRKQLSQLSSKPKADNEQQEPNSDIDTESDTGNDTNEEPKGGSSNFELFD